jgi:hypothetical protein
MIKLEEGLVWIYRLLEMCRTTPLQIDVLSGSGALEIIASQHGVGSISIAGAFTTRIYHIDVAGGRETVVAVGVR